MRKMIVPLLAYLIVCIIAVLIPASEGYNTFLWKLFVGQIYAIPALIIVFFISKYVTRKLSHT